LEVPEGGRRRLARAIWYVVAILVLLSADAGDRPYAPPARPPYLTVFLLDGLSKEVFERELAAGRLPQIAKLIREGTWIRNGIASFPSMTAYGFYPFITANDASKSGVLGLRYFDRTRPRGNLRSYVGSTHGLMNRDFVAQPRTLYEHFPGSHSFSINTYANRGVKEDVKIGWSFTMAKYHGRWWVPDLLARVPLAGSRLVPSWEGAESEVIERAIDDLSHRPKIQWLTFASIDAYQHVNGTDERYAELVRWADTLIGRYRSASEALGLERDRVYAVLTDHGVANARENLDLREVLGRAGIPAKRDEATHLFGSELEQPLSEWQGAEAVVVINGNMLNYLYFRDASGSFAERIPLEELRSRPVDVVALLTQEPGVELVIGRSKSGESVVTTARGKGFILKSEMGLSYRTEAEDPFGYDPALADGKPRSANDWLTATLGTRFPDAPYRVSALMEQRDVGDLVVTAVEGFDFGKDYELFVHDYRGGHGGLRDDQLRVPYVLAGPGIRPGARIEAARAEDVGRTLFQLLGVPLPEADGQLLAAALLR
jgi:hypothetical protein